MNEITKLKMTSTVTTIVTWNFRSLSRFGKLEDLNRELENYKWDVIGLAET